MSTIITCPACQADNTANDAHASRDDGVSCVVCGHLLRSPPQPSSSVDILIVADSLDADAVPGRPTSSGRDQTIDMVQDATPPPARVRVGTSADRSETQAQALIAAGGMNVTNKFTIVEELNRGGMGVVLRGRDKGLHREVAIKVIRDQDNQHQRSRFVKEAQITGQLEHPNIVPVHEFGLDESGRMFFAMKLVRGRNLAEVLDDHRNNLPTAATEFPVIKMVGILVQVCNAIAFAHSRGVIHRDLKPSNIMLGDFGEVMLMDWGLAKVGDPAAIGSQREADQATSMQPTGDESTRATVGRFEDTVDGAVIGTPAYMPPEQAAGLISHMDARSDVYALGAILYEMLTLQPPITGHDIKDVLRKAMMGAIVTPSVRTPDRTIPKDLEAIAMKALNTDPASRYPGASLMRRDLENFLEGRAVSARADSVVEAVGKFVRRHRITSTAVGCAAVLLLAVLSGSYVVNVHQRERAEDERAVAVIERSRAQSESDKAKSASERAEQALQVADQQRSVAEEERRLSTSAFEREQRQREQSEAQNHLASLALAGEQIGHHEYAAARASLEGCPARYRDWVWRRLSLLCRQQLALFADHGDARAVIASNADGSLMVSAGANGLAVVYDLSTRRRIGQIMMPAAGIRAVALSADGTRVLTGGRDGSLRLWMVGASEPSLVIAGNEVAVTAVAFAIAEPHDHPPGQAHDQIAANHAAVGTHEDVAIYGSIDGAVRAVDLVDGHLRRDFGRLTEPVHALAVISHGQRLIAGGDAGEIVCFDLGDGHLAASARLPGAVLAIDGHGPQVLVAGPHAAATVWDLGTQRPRCTLAGHVREVTCAVFSASGRQVATGSADSDGRVWDIMSGSCAVTLSGHGGAVTGVCFAHNDSQLVTSSDDATVRLWDALHRRDIAELDVPTGLSSASLSPDGQHLITGGSDGTALICDMATASSPPHQHLSLSHGAAIASTAYSRDGHWVATAGAGGICRIWDAQTGMCRCTMMGSPAALLGVAVSPDGADCITVSSDGTAQVWDTRDGTARHTCDGHVGAIWAAAYSPDGRVIATAGADATIRTFQAQSGRPLAVIPTHNASVVALAFSPDSRHLLSACDQIAEIYDAVSGEKTQSLRGHTGPVLRVSYGADGTQAMTASSDGSARIWDAASGRVLLVLREHKAPVVAILPSPNDRDMVTADRTGRIIIWSAGDP